ncbi:MAG: hypothetical protein ACI9S8_003052 [Chlamydiales bacterium]|jgi:hypothetical protein
MSEEEEKKSAFWRVYCQDDSHGDVKWSSRWTERKAQAENALKTHQRATGHIGNLESSDNPFPKNKKRKMTN